MQSRTVLTAKKSPFEIGREAPVLTLGSCFSDNIGQQLKAHKFAVAVNPAGVVFHPQAIHRLIGWALGDDIFDDHWLTQREDLWLHLGLHSQHFAFSKDDLLQKAGKVRQEIRQSLTADTTLILTWGTAFGYWHRALGQVVANCHKLPQQLFEKRLSSPQDILEDSRLCFGQLFQKLPKLRIIITVSPIRHIKDGITANSRSKAHLIAAAHALADDFEQVEYYPAYELVMDDLRSYRYYKPDMLHPTDEAIQYIWQHFQQTYFSEKTAAFVREWAQIREALAHRPMHPGSQQEAKFLSHLKQRLLGFRHEVDVSDELKQIGGK